MEGSREDTDWAVLIVSYGGPEHADEVVPFVEEVLEGKTVSEHRKREVIDHYRVCGGVSPLNQHVREIRWRVNEDLNERYGREVPVFWGNRYGAPSLDDAVTAILESGVTTVYVWTTSAYGGFAAERRYETAVANAVANAVAARAEREGRDGSAVPRRVPEFRFLGRYAEEQRFLEATVSVLSGVPAIQDASSKGGGIPVLFTAHSVPEAMSGVEIYVNGVRSVAQYVTERLGLQRTFLAYQSRSGSPRQPWIGPTVFEAIDAIGAIKAIDAIDAIDARRHVVVVPIGFVVDNMEISYDLETELTAYANAREISIHVAPTVGRGTDFHRIVGDLIEKQWGRTTHG